MLLPPVSGANILITQDIEGKKIRIGENKKGKSIDISGVEGNRRMTGVKDGIADNDAVNLKQLKAHHRAIKKLDNRIDQVKNKLTAGIASSIAMAGIPQALMPLIPVYSVRRLRATVMDRQLLSASLKFLKAGSG
nr:hypothetical protein [Candidatus Regiella insecticola]